uniref:Apple domain-containing protein n=1 Tax=Panagrolaimus sp. JU765 TaxID=591449 RepID=A0AC34Q3T8_9BILA
MVADVIQELPVSDVQLCAEYCLNSTDFCSGIYFPDAYTCRLLKMVRNIVDDPNECHYYVFDRGNNATVSNLNQIDSYVYYNNYKSSFDACPQGWTLSGNNCILVTDDGHYLVIIVYWLLILQLVANTPRFFKLNMTEHLASLQRNNPTAVTPHLVFN